MKIAYLLAAPGISIGGPSGSSRHVDAMVRAMVELGLDVEVFAWKALDAGGLPCPVTVLLEEKPPFYVRGRAGLEAWAARRLAREAIRKLKPAPPDLVYERYSLFSNAGELVAKQFGVPWWLEVNAPLRLERSRYEGLRSDWRAVWAERRILTRADRVLAVSSPLRDQLTALGVAPERLRVTPNGVDLRRFVGRPRRRRSPVTLGFLGSLKPWHGLDLWVKIFRQLQRRGHEIKGKVIGGGPLEQAFQDWLAVPELKDRVQLLGHIPPERVPLELESIDVMLAPYPAIEPFYFSPLKLLEAQALGIPVVTRAAGDLPMLTGRGGICVEGGGDAASELEGWVDAVESLLKNDQLYDDCSLAAVEQSQTRGWNRLAADLFGDFLARR